jgi:prepilin-type N-terminal cleavage/methylation domain-containing protein
MNRRGFTLIELGIVVAIAAILAALAIGAMDATRRNTGVDGTALDLTAQVQGLRFTALAEQRDHLLVIVSPPSNDATNCGIFTPGSCVRSFVLRSPQAGWNVKDFDADAPGVLADFVESTALPRGVVLHLAGAGTPAPAPFENAWVFAPDVTASCRGNRTCLAVRLTASGEVRAEYVAAPGATRGGVAIGLATDLEGIRGNAQRRAVFVSFPSGIARSFPY